MSIEQYVTKNSTKGQFLRIFNAILRLIREQCYPRNRWLRCIHSHLVWQLNPYYWLIFFNNVIRWTVFFKEQRQLKIEATMSGPCLKTGTIHVWPYLWFLLVVISFPGVTSAKFTALDNGHNLSVIDRQGVVDSLLKGWNESEFSHNIRICSTCIAIDSHKNARSLLHNSTLHSF